MVAIQPFYHWREYYDPELDRKSPFHYPRYQDTMQFSVSYNQVIHPEWEDIGSEGLFMKVLFADYYEGCAILEGMGDWNDCTDIDIKSILENLIHPLFQEGVSRFLLIGENILNFHGDYPDYYEEIRDLLEDDGGYFMLLNLRQHVIEEMKSHEVNHFTWMGEQMQLVNWRTMQPLHVVAAAEEKITKQLSI